jgi:hypothetical protein
MKRKKKEIKRKLGRSFIKTSKKGKNIFLTVTTLHLIPRTVLKLIHKKSMSDLRE